MCVCTCKRTHACAQLCPTLCDPMDSSHPGSSVHGISQAEHWCGLPFPTPGDIPNPGIELVSLVSPALQMDSLLWSHQGSPIMLEGEFRKSSSGLFWKMSRTCREEGRGKGHALLDHWAGEVTGRARSCRAFNTKEHNVPVWAYWQFDWHSLVLLTFQFPRLVHDSMLVT